MNGNSRHLNRSEPANLSMYGSEDGLSAGTASTASLRGIGVSSSLASHRVPSPSLSLSESTPTHTDCTEDMGSTSVLDAAGMPSPGRSPAPSPDLRYSNRRGRKGAASPLARPSQKESTDRVSASLTMAEPRRDMTVQVTPGSPQIKGNHLPEAQTTTTLQTAVTSATADALATESETTWL
ncbi:unnamed protein product [Candidula unifasciata]|uniref:Uncharacterized protein n=1 Tax=Candidula unifasciata TaxID=100452 RepID=A0A8S3YK27_9EUPU|nr:unnamed protein product [Candidula unifasciata]